MGLEADGKKKVFVVDDHPVICEMLKMIIGNMDDFDLCGQADSIKNALEQIEQLKPDLVIADIDLKDGKGVDLIKKIKNDLKLDSLILVYSGHNEHYYFKRVFEAGAMGFITKDEPMERMVNAIRHIASGESYVSKKVIDNVCKALRD